MSTSYRIQWQGAETPRFPAIPARERTATPVEVWQYIRHLECVVSCMAKYVPTDFPATQWAEKTEAENKEGEQAK